MSVGTHVSRGTPEEARDELIQSLRAPESEVPDVIFAHVRTMSEPPDEGEHAEYIAGLRATVIEALDFIFMAIEQEDVASTSIPSAAVAQARRAARFGVSLDTVLRRYAAGERYLVEFIMEEAKDFPSDSVRHLLKAHGQLVDRFMATVASEYMDELARATRSPERLQAECVERLLIGEPVDTSRLGYELEGSWHLGMVVMGAGAIKIVTTLAETIGCRLLFIPRGEQTAWAWIGGARPPVIADIERFLAKEGHQDVSLAIGEPANGL